MVWFDTQRRLAIIFRPAVKEHGRIADIIGRVTACSARPDLVLASISSMIAAVIVLALRVTLGSS